MTGGALTWVNATWPGAAFADQVRLSGAGGSLLGCWDGSQGAGGPLCRMPVHARSSCLLLLDARYTSAPQSCIPPDSCALLLPTCTPAGCQVRLCGRPGSARQLRGRPSHAQARVQCMEWRSRACATGPELSCSTVQPQCCLRKPLACSLRRTHSFLALAPRPPICGSGYAHGSYEQVCGEGHGTVGDAVVPLGRWAGGGLGCRMGAES